MPNFRHILSLIIFICVEVQFIAYCEDFEPVHKYDWEVEEDEIKVEELVVQYAREKTISPGVLQRMFSALTRNDPPSTQFSETRRLVDFSTIAEEDKLFMCTAIIRLNYFGLEFQQRDEDTMNIIEKDISLQWLSYEALATGTLSMFQCPILQYIDLETGEPIALLIKYFIAGAHLRDSFFLFLQEGSDLPIYPHKFASGVKLIAFEVLRGNYNLVEQDDKANEEKMKVHSEIPETEVRLTEFMDSKKSKYVYTKFRNLFKSFVVCGMPRVHLIALCRYIAHNLDLEVDHRGYDEFNCLKREVFSEALEPEKSDSVFLGHLHMVKCPAVVFEVDGKENKFSIETMFVAASQRSRSVFVLKRLNLPRQNVILEAAISALRLPTLKKDRNRTREFLKPQYTERKPRYSDLTTELIRLSGLDTFFRGPPSITFNRNVVEDNTIIFMRLKETKKPYDRFGASYMSININTWSEKDVAYVCHLILQDKSYNLDFEQNFEADQDFEPRLRIQVQLAMRDAELLHSKKTVARQCPRGFQTSSTYFIVGTIYKDAFTVHVKYNDNDYAFPETYIQNIHKAQVQAVTRNEKLFPSLL